jgi:hypothetical protein
MLQDGLLNKRKRIETAPSSGANKLPMPKSVLDCFTGRYVYDVYKVWREEARRQHQLAIEKES